MQLTDKWAHAHHGHPFPGEGEGDVPGFDCDGAKFAQFLAPLGVFGCCRKRYDSRFGGAGHGPGAAARFAPAALQQLPCGQNGPCRSAPGKITATGFFVNK